MNENIKQLNTVQQIRDDFRIIALTALIATAAIWVFVSMNIFWAAIVYFGFLLIISLIYSTIDYYGHDTEIDNDS